MRIASAQGAHLTDADRRNIKLLLAHEGFTPGEWFRVGRRKQYLLTQACPPLTDRWDVAVRETSRDDWGRPVTRTHRSQITVAA